MKVVIGPIMVLVVMVVVILGVGIFTDTEFGKGFRTGLWLGAGFDEINVDDNSTVYVSKGLSQDPEPEKIIAYMKEIDFFKAGAEQDLVIDRGIEGKTADYIIRIIAPSEIFDDYKIVFELLRDNISQAVWPDGSHKMQFVICDEYFKIHNMI